MHLLSKLQNWISPKTGQYKTCIVSNTKIDCVYICIYITHIFLYIYYIYIIYTYVYIKKRHISRKYIYMYLYTHNQSLVLDTKQVLYGPVLDQIQFCSFDRRCKTCLDTKPVLYQGRFWSLTYVRVYITLLHATIDRCLTHARKNTNGVESLTACIIITIWQIQYKDHLFQLQDFHYKDKTVVRSSYKNREFLYRHWNFVINMMRSRDRHNFIIGIPILVRRYISIGTVTSTVDF